MHIGVELAHQATKQCHIACGGHQGGERGRRATRIKHGNVEVVQQTQYLHTARCVKAQHFDYVQQDGTARNTDPWNSLESCLPGIYA